MSGRKQHYIPQCLLKGFKSPSSGKKPQVVVFKHDSEAYISSIEDVAAQRHFYSELSDGDQKTLDDRITDYERRLSPMLDKLRASDSGVLVDPLLAAEVVTHLTIRSAFARGFLTLGVRELLEGASDFLADGEAVRQYLGIDSGETNSILEVEIGKIIDLLQLPHEGARVAVKRILLFSIRESFTHEYSKNTEELVSNMKSLRSSLPKMIKEVHSKVLSDSVAPDERVEALAQLKWTSVRADSNSLFILPDCLALSRVKGMHDEFVPYLLHSNDELTCILVPLSSTQLLIGNLGEAVFEIDTTTINSSLAKCSFEFFISSSRDKQIGERSSLIGSQSRSNILTTVKESIKSLYVNETREQLPTILDRTGENSGPSNFEVAQVHTFPVTFIDCADQSIAEQIGAVVHAAVKALSARMSVRRIESITFALNYEVALSAIDRGFKTSTPLTTTSTEFGIGVAMAPMVRRSNGVQCCIVMRSWLGNALLATDATEFQTALHTLASMVAHASYLEIIDTAFPGILLQQIEDPWDGFFVNHIFRISENYYCARTVANINNDLADGYRVLFLGALRKAAETIPVARSKYKTNGEFEEFLQVTIPLVIDVLSHAATLIGYFDALDEEVVDHEETRKLLVEMSLLRWVEIFHRDLDAHYRQLSKWEDLREFLSLTVHVERMLWQFGLIAWKTGDEQVRIEVPDEGDMAAFISFLGRGSK